MNPISDEGESWGLMEPMLPGESSPYNIELENLVFELVTHANRLAGRLHPLVQVEIGKLVCSMNCYYSNLIEGHFTHPIDIDRALKQDFSSEPKKRILQLEAKAHIEVQTLIDHKHPIFENAWYEEKLIRTIHREFCSRLPPEMLRVENATSSEEAIIVPGELRQRMVQVGLHVAISPGAIPRFLTRFENAYSSKHLSKTKQIIAVASAHHRLLWIHPFLDGNGRVTRLMSHKALQDLGVGSSLWSVSRGLARQADNYKKLLMQADNPREGDLDGRGSRSERALAEFCKFFLATCVDQVQFMDGLIEPSKLVDRALTHLSEEVRAKKLHPQALPLVREALLNGSIERSSIMNLTNLKDRQARFVVSQLVERGILTAPHMHAPLTIAFPMNVAERWFPNLYIGPLMRE